MPTTVSIQKLVTTWERMMFSEIPKIRAVRTVEMRKQVFVFCFVFRFVYFIFCV